MTAERSVDGPDEVPWGPPAPGWEVWYDGWSKAHSRYLAGLPARDEAEREHYRSIAETEAEIAEAEKRSVHFNGWAGDGGTHSPEHELSCAPETGGCPWKSEAENRTDLEAWYAGQESDTEPEAEL